MNLPDIIDQTWMHALGWTLVHSLWQGLAILLATLTLLRFVDKRWSSLRYLIACSAMAFVLAVSVITFVVKVYAPAVSAGFGAAVTSVAFHATSDAETDRSLIQIITSEIEQHMSLLILIWGCGSFLFLLRMAGGLYYLHRLTGSAVPLSRSWQETVIDLVEQLGITKVVRLAESVRIDSPMVIGYLKPVILLPTGMIGGLTTDQVEAILLHELAHIKRHDFLVNIIQSCVEIIFFFNPFTWILSDVVRKEREYCCDDVVVMSDRNVLAYAQALAALEHARIGQPSFGVALAGEKKHLLNRIKRIMEKPLKRKIGRERLVPVVLLVLGLVCASWLSIRGDEKNFRTAPATSPDTLKKLERSAAYYRKSVRSKDKDGNVSETITEDYDGDDSLLPMAVMAPPDFDPLVGHSFAMPGFPAFPDHISYYHLDGDSVPLRKLNGANLQRFSIEFEQQFKEKFADFYKKHGADISKIMQEVQRNIEADLSQEEWVDVGDLNAALAGQADALRNLQLPMEMDIARQALQHVESAFGDLEVQQGIQAQQMAELAANMDDLEFANLDQFRALDEKLENLEKEMAVFEAELKKELVKDGYIGKDEEIKNMSWEDDGTIEVNGKKIKDSDKKKYEELHKKYFKNGPGRFHYVE
jgi:bla regulator protein blaR1